MREEDREAFRAANHRGAVAAVHGVAWSGLGPDRFRPADGSELDRNEAGRRAYLQAWRMSAAGQALAALTEVERQAEAIRTALARDPSEDLGGRGAALTAAALAVRRALG